MALRQGPFDVLFAEHAGSIPVGYLRALASNEPSNAQAATPTASMRVRRVKDFMLQLRNRFGGEC